MDLYTVTHFRTTVGVFASLEAARDHASETALYEFNNGNTASHVLINKWNGSTDLGTVEHVYGWDVNEQRKIAKESTVVDEKDAIAGTKVTVTFIVGPLIVTVSLSGRDDPRTPNA